MLRTHLIICSILLLFCIPVYLIDHYWLKSSGGNWISLDFSKFLIGAYVVFLGAHFTISTILFLYSPHCNLLKTHLVSAGISLVLIVLAFVLFNKFNDYKYQENQETSRENRETYFNDIRIVKWWYVPDSNSPKEIHVDLEVAATGRFAGHATGKKEGDNANKIFSSDGEEQRLVKAGEKIHYVFPLIIDIPGHASDVEFTFYLFKHPAGESGPDDASKVFKKSVNKIDDGSYFYENLLPPLDHAPQ